MTVAELIEKLKALPPDAEIYISGYGVPLPRLLIHDVSSAFPESAFLSLCTPETAEREKTWYAQRVRPSADGAA